MSTVVVVFASIGFAAQSRMTPAATQGVTLGCKKSAEKNEHAARGCIHERCYTHSTDSLRHLRVEEAILALLGACLLART